MQINKEGVSGELFAARYMRDNGYMLVLSNYRCRFGEIDIIGKKDGYICFVEVKTRSENAIYEPKEAVGSDKQARIIAAAQTFSQVYPYTEQMRFDVCEVFLNEKRQAVKINYIENAFNG